MEWRLILRSALFRTAAIVCWGLAMLLVHGVLAVQSSTFLSLAEPDELTAQAVELQIGLFVPTMVGFIAAFSAARERRPGVPETLFTTPPSSEEFVLGKFLSVLLASLVLLAGTVAAGALWLRYGEGLPSHMAPFIEVARWWWKPTVMVAGLGYTAGLALPGAIGGAVVTAYLVAVLVAARFISPVFYPFFGFLSGGYMLAGLSLVFLAAAFYYGERRGTHRATGAFSLLVGIGLLAGGSWQLATAVRSYTVPPFHRQRWLSLVGREHAEPGQPLPPFEIRDLQGATIGSSSLEGRPTVFIILPELPPPVGEYSPARALVNANRRVGAHRANLVLVALTRDPEMGAEMGRAIDSSIPIICEYKGITGSLTGLTAMLGLKRELRTRDHPGRDDTIFGAVAVVDRNGRYLGWRKLYDLFRPPALLQVLTGGSDANADPERAREETLRSEQQTAYYFLQALWDYSVRQSPQAGETTDQNPRVFSAGVRPPAVVAGKP